MKRRLTTIGLMLALLTGLCACAGGQINKNMSFGPDDDNALILLGVTTEADGMRTAPRFVWTRFDPESGALGPDYKIVRHRADEDMWDFLNSANLFLADSGGHNMFVFKLPPGTWVLEQLFAWRRTPDGMAWSNGILIPKYKDTLRQHMLDGGSFAITVAAGEVTYVGELVVGDRDALTVTRGIDRPDDARARLTEFPEVTAGLRYAPMLATTFACAERVMFGALAACAPKSDQGLP